MLFQEEKTISFEQLPQAVATLISEIQELKAFLKSTNLGQIEPADRWFNLQELSDYLPDHPARQTVYGWIGQKLIPYHKKGKKLQFLKSEIDAWLITDKHKTIAELQAEAQNFLNAKERRATR